MLILIAVAVLQVTSPPPMDAMDQSRQDLYLCVERVARRFEASGESADAVGTATVRACREELRAFLTATSAGDARFAEEMDPRVARRVYDDAVGIVVSVRASRNQPLGQ